MYSDPDIFNCYYNCLLERQDLQCNPFEFNDNFTEDCCSKCDGTDFPQELTYRSSGGESTVNICTPISKVMEVQSSDPVICALETTVSTDYFSLPVVYSSCACGRKSSYSSLISEKSIARCIQDCLSVKDGSPCDRVYYRGYDLEDCCSKCDGRRELRKVPYFTPNSGWYETKVCIDLSPDPNAIPVRDSYSLEFENEPKENLDISRHVIDAALTSELKAGYNSTVETEFFFDESEEGNQDEEVNSDGTLIEQDRIALRIQEEKLALHRNEIFVPKPEKYIEKASQRATQQRKTCKPNTNCGILITFKKVRTQNGRSEKEVVHNSESHWKKKGVEQDVFDEKKKYEPKYDKKSQLWKLKAKFNQKYLDPKTGNSLFR